jgi:tetratricopeptide (TPR) repeat protein
MNTKHPNTPFEAAKVLYKANQKKDAFLILQKVWMSIEKWPAEEFQIFGALIELSIVDNKKEVLLLLDSVLSGEGGFRTFLERRSISEQSILLDWQGQIAFIEKDFQVASDSLSRSASLGRDTSLIWRLLGDLYIQQGDLDIAIRYVKRSLQIYRQLDLNLVSGREYPLGFFTGKSPIDFGQSLDSYLDLLLRITKVAKSQRNLKGVREIVIELMHQFPNDQRLPKIRNLLEKSWVDMSLNFSQQPSAKRLTLEKPRINPPRNI